MHMRYDAIPLLASKLCVKRDLSTVYYPLSIVAKRFNIAVYMFITLATDLATLKIITEFR